MATGSLVFLSALTGSLERAPSHDEIRVVQAISMFAGGALFGAGLTRLLPEPEQIRSYFRRKLLGS
jgi:hypothetical protein